MPALPTRRRTSPAGTRESQGWLPARTPIPARGFASWPQHTTANGSRRKPWPQRTVPPTLRSTTARLYRPDASRCSPTCVSKRSRLPHTASGHPTTYRTAWCSTSPLPAGPGSVLFLERREVQIGGIQRLFRFFARVIVLCIVVLIHGIGVLACLGRRLDSELPVPIQAGSGGNELTDDDVFLQAFQTV